MEKQNHILAYRKKHPRCRYCVFYEWSYSPAPHIPSYPRCRLKNRRLREYFFLAFLENIQGWTCKFFKAKKDRQLEALWH